ncbi:MAG: hypothetical protein QOK43_2915 [Acidimicrobiaceae bacterium]|nr:hypothetical protein [Acidimicrobiaceae bacterium]
MTAARGLRVAHLTTVDLSLRFLLLAQLDAVVAAGGEAFAISAPGPYTAELEERGITFVPLAASTRSMNPWADVRAAVELFRILRRLRVDVLHTHNPKPGLYGRVVGRLARVPVVVNTVHGLYAAPTDPAWKRALVYTAEVAAARLSHAELVQSPEDFDLLCGLPGYPRARARWLGNGVDLARFDRARFDAAHRTRMRAELGIEDGEVAVGCVARLVAEKGIPELLDAARRLGPGYRLVLVGPADEDKPGAVSSAVLERAVREAGVRVLGMRADVDALYPAFDVFVLASHREGFPRAAMEAAAMGLPVVATDVRGCRQVVDDGVTGLLVPVRDPGALAAAIAAVGGDPARRSAMSTAARARARAQFDERRVVDTVMETYAALTPAI